MHQRHFLQKIDDPRLVAAIRATEKITSAEVRVFVSHHHVGDVLEAAWRAFKRLGMRHTKRRNGVLIFVAPASQKFAIVGDAAVHTCVGQPAWDAMAAELSEHFARMDFTDGLIHVIKAIGEKAARSFPADQDQNELPDAVARD